MNEIDPRALRDAFGTFMTGVTVVTTVADDGSPRGFTANSFTSVSLSPPLLLVCVGKQVGSLESYIDGKGFAVNILAENQREISNIFATPDKDRFANVDWQAGPNGNPIIKHSNAWFDCSLKRVMEAGDHYILLGEVMGFEHNEANGLGFAKGSYFTISDGFAALNAIENNKRILTGALVERNNEILLIKNDDHKLELPITEDTDHETSLITLRQLLNDINITAPIGNIYSIYEQSKNGAFSIYYHVSESSDNSAELTRGSYYPIDTLPIEELADSATKTMIKRFIKEHRQRRFGIYIGNESSGNILPRSGETS